jgi:MFS family permease
MVACRPMHTESYRTVLSTVAVSWLAAVAALGSALVLAVLGQGLGAAAGGCSWIGASIPLHRPVWALVNQPTIAFSSSPGASGYWLGSLAGPFLVALVVLTLRPKAPTLVGQLVVIQTVWWTAVVPGVWLPLLDPVDGHLARWLLLHRLPSILVWSAPAAATVLAAFASSRMLEVARRRSPDMSRAVRIGTLAVHLGLPVVGLLCVVRALGGSLPLRPVLGLAAPLAAAFSFAWFHYPRPYPRPLKAPSRSAIAALTAVALVTPAAVWWAGRPLPEDRVSGVLWSGPQSLNNIRSWIDPSPISLGESEDDRR